jgi:MFS family permease
MRKRGRRAQKPLTDQEVAQHIIRITQWIVPYSLQEVRKRTWLSALVAIFFVGPFISIVLAFLWLSGLKPREFFLVPWALNAIVSLAYPIGFHLSSEQLKRRSQMDRWKDCANFWGFLHVGWLLFFASGVFLFLGLLTFWEYHLPGWWILLAGYVGSGGGLGWKRKTLLRAMAEPQAYPWTRPLRALFATSVGFWILFSALARIFLNIVGKISGPMLSDVVGSTIMFAGSLFLLGLAVLVWSMAYLYYQRWHGAEELKL